MSSTNPLLYLPQFSSPNPSILDLERLSKRYPKVSRPLFLLNALLILLLLFKISYCFNALRLAPECFANTEDEKEKRLLSQKSQIIDQNRKVHYFSNNNEIDIKKNMGLEFSLNNGNIINRRNEIDNIVVDRTRKNFFHGFSLNKSEMIDDKIANMFVNNSAMPQPFKFDNASLKNSNDSTLESISESIPIFRAVINSSSQSQSTPSELVLPVVAGIIWFIASFILAVGVQRRILKCFEVYLFLVFIVLFLELLAGIHFFLLLY